MTREEKIYKELVKFREKVDKIFIGETPKIEGPMDDIYDCDIYIYRHPGMGNSKQIISGDKVSIATITASYLEQLMRQGMFDEKEIKQIVRMSIDAVKGKLK